MPFPATGGVKAPLTLDAAWASARSAASVLKQQATVLNSQIAAGSVTSQQLLNALTFFIAVNSQLTTYAAVPGIAAYGQAQVSDATLDVAAAFTAMQSALQAVGSWILTNFPAESDGYLKAVRFVNSVPTYDIYTSGQLAGLATLLTALSATIN